MRLTRLILVLCASRAIAAPPDSFDKTVQPVLTANCLPCHNQKLHQAGLDLSTREAALKGSENGPVIAVGKPEDSRLYKLR